MRLMCAVVCVCVCDVMDIVCHVFLPPLEKENRLRVEILPFESVMRNVSPVLHFFFFFF